MPRSQKSNVVAVSVDQMAFLERFAIARFVRMTLGMHVKIKFVSFRKDKMTLNSRNSNQAINDATAMAATLEDSYRTIVTITHMDRYAVAAVEGGVVARINNNSPGRVGIGETALLALQAIVRP